MLAILALIAVPAFAASTPAEEKEWLACARTSQCTSIELGCYYWQPVNKAFASAMRERYPIACLKSAPSGPQPPSACKRGVCVLDFNVRFWKSLGKDDASIRSQWVAERIDACVRAASVRLDDEDRWAWIARGLAESERRLAGKGFPDSAPLARVLEAAIPCEGPVAVARLKAKWSAAQDKDRSQVRVEKVEGGYPLDGLYPPLIGYKKDLEGCVASQGKPAPWGEMRLRFSIGADGKIVADSFTGTFMAARLMQAFIDCVSTPFKRLAFPRPEGGAAVAVEAAYTVPLDGGP